MRNLILIIIFIVIIKFIIDSNKKKEKYKTMKKNTIPLVPGQIKPTNIKPKKREIVNSLWDPQSKLIKKLDEEKTYQEMIDDLIGNQKGDVAEKDFILKDTSKESYVQRINDIRNNKVNIQDKEIQSVFNDLSGTKKKDILFKYDDCSNLTNYHDRI